MKPLFDFMAQKWNLLQTNYVMFSLKLWRQTPHALFQNSNIMRCKWMRIFDFKNWRHGLKGQRNWAIILFSLTEQLFIAPSPCISGSTWLKFCPIVYTYTMHSSFYTKGVNFIQDPTYSIWALFSNNSQFFH